VGQEREALGARHSDQDAIDRVVVELVRQPIALDRDLWRSGAIDSAAIAIFDVEDAALGMPVDLNRADDVAQDGDVPRTQPKISRRGSSSAGTSLATGLPRLVMTIDRAWHGSRP
jgi:hypothetical protein